MRLLIDSASCVLQAPHYLLNTGVTMLMYSTYSLKVYWTRQVV